MGLLQSHNSEGPQLSLKSLHSPWLQLRLVPYCTVANSNGASPGQGASRVTHDDGSDEYHCPISQLVIEGFHICTIWFNLEKKYCVDPRQFLPRKTFSTAILLQNRRRVNLATNWQSNFKNLIKSIQYHRLHASLDPISKLF